MTNQDRALLIGSGMALVGSIMVGKIVIDQLVDSNKRAKKAQYDEEGFEAAHAYAYGLAEAAKKPVPLNDIVRFLGTIYGLYTLYQQTPGLLTEFQRLAK